MGGKFIALEEDSEEYMESILLGVQLKRTGEFVCLEEDREEFSIDVLLGKEGIIPEPPEKPRVGRRRKKYIDRIFRQDMRGLNILKQNIEERDVRTLSLPKKYIELYFVTLGRMATMKTITYSTQLLKLTNEYFDLIMQKGLDISKLHKDEIDMSNLSILISKSMMHSVVGITLLSSFSAEMNVNTPDVDKIKLKKLMGLINDMEHLDKVTKTKTSSVD